LTSIYTKDFNPEALSVAILSFNLDELALDNNFKVAIPILLEFDVPKDASIISCLLALVNEGFSRVFTSFEQEKIVAKKKVQVNAS